MKPRTVTRLTSGAAVLVVLCAFSTDTASQAPAETGSMLARLGKRIQQYYDRITSIMCTETVSQQELRFDLKPTGKPRHTVYELIVVREPDGKGGEPPIHVERRLTLVNGREARRGDRPGCTDPKAIATEPLDFLLPQRQHKYRFFAARATGGPSGTVPLDFEETPPQRVNVTWEGNCFNAEGGGAKGRLWVDPRSYDVLQLDVRLPKPFRIKVPAGLGLLSSTLRVERSETTFRFARVNFQNPDETVLLLESMETLTVFLGAPSLRTTQHFSNFRRFLSEIKISGAR